MAAAKKGVPFSDPNASTASAALSDGGATDADTSMASAAGGAQQPRSKKMKPNAPGEDSAMDVDGDEEEEDDDDDDDAQDEDDDVEEDEEEDDEDVGDDEEDDEEEDEEGDEAHDALEERPKAKEDDEALDNGDDSDS